MENLSSCAFCKSKNIGKYQNPLHSRECNVCFYCYTIFNNSFSKQFNKYDAIFINKLNDFTEEVIKLENYNNISIFDRLVDINDVDHTNKNYHLIQNYDNENSLNALLKNGKFELLIVPNIHCLNINNFLSKINPYLSNEASIIIPFYREKYYCNHFYDYKYIYNCYSIDRIANKYNLYVQSHYYYSENLYIIKLGKNEPADFEIKELESLVNKHLIEDFQNVFFNNLTL